MDTIDLSNFSNNHYNDHFKTFSNVELKAYLLSNRIYQAGREMLHCKEMILVHQNYSHGSKDK